tara:strand:+ start:459 stop:1070 length:612 start_codon:yes stop_codon:yes gene_type:complete
MTEELIPFHALPIYKQSTDFLLTEEEKNIVLEGQFSRQKKGNSISKNVEVLENKNLFRVKNFILSKFDNFITNHLQIENQFVLTQSWISVNYKGDAHHLHTHNNTIFSCVYYIQANSGDLQIKTPLSRIQEGYNFSYNVLNKNIFNWNEYNISVKTGDIIIFPGWLEHQALPNQNEEPRIILGTNYFIKGTIGNRENVNQIKI